MRDLAVGLRLRTNLQNTGDNQRAANKAERAVSGPAHDDANAGGRQVGRAGSFFVAKRRVLGQIKRSEQRRFHLDHVAVKPHPFAAKRQQLRGRLKAKTTSPFERLSYVWCEPSQFPYL